MLSLRTLSRLSLVAGAALGLATLAAPPARADLAYDPVRNTYYTVGDHTLSTDLSGANVLVGKNPTTLATLPGSTRLTLAAGGVVTQNPNFVSYPNGRFYSGTFVFGQHSVEVTGGSAQLIQAEENSRASLRDGGVQTLVGANRSTLEVSGGSVSSLLNLFEQSQAFQTGGSVALAQVRSGTTYHYGGGTVGDAIYLFEPSAATNLLVYGNGVSFSYRFFNGNFDFFRATGTRADGSGQAFAFDIAVRNSSGSGNQTQRGFSAVNGPLAVPEAGSLPLLAPAAVAALTLRGAAPRRQRRRDPDC